MFPEGVSYAEDEGGGEGWELENMRLKEWDWMDALELCV